MFWIIFGCIMLIILALIFSPIIIDFEYFNGKLKIILKYLFFRRILVGEGKEESAKKVKERSEKDKLKKEKVKEKKSDKKSEKNISSKIDFIKQLIRPCKNALIRIIKHIKITKIYIDFTISNMDAYECAVNFGKANTIVFNALSYLGNLVKLKKKSINIKCVYNKPESVYDIKFKIRLTPAVLIMTGIVFICSFLVNNIKTAFITKRNEKLNNSLYGRNGENHE